MPAQKLARNWPKSLPSLSSTIESKADDRHVLSVTSATGTVQFLSHFRFWLSGGRLGLRRWCS